VAQRPHSERQLQYHLSVPIYIDSNSRHHNIYSWSPYVRRPYLSFSVHPVIQTWEKSHFLSVSGHSCLFNHGLQVSRADLLEWHDCGSEKTIPRLLFSSFSICPAVPWSKSRSALNNPPVRPRRTPNSIIPTTSSRIRVAGIESGRDSSEIRFNVIV
jgi:hypothetical protein